MENRKIIIVSTRTQRKYTLTTDATTLADLKAVCDAQNIDYSGMSWFEGTSKTEMMSDNSVLPHDVPYKGTVTNNLVFHLTPTKKIASGMDRKEMYALIRNNNLGEQIKQLFGKNYTQCTNADLESVVGKIKETPIEDTYAALNSDNMEIPAITLDALLSVLFEKGLISAADFLDYGHKENEDEVFSDEEIAEMFAD